MPRLSPLKLIGTALLLAGATLMLWAVAAWAGGSMPYQDAPAELLAQQAKELQRAETVFYAGLFSAAVGLGVLWRARAGRGRPFQPTDLA